MAPSAINSRMFSPFDASLASMSTDFLVFAGSRSETYRPCRKRSLLRGPCGLPPGLCWRSALRRSERKPNTRRHLQLIALRVVRFDGRAIGVGRLVGDDGDDFRGGEDRASACASL